MLIIATLATYFIHLPQDVLIGLFGFVIGHGGASFSSSQQTTVIRPLGGFY